MQTLCFSMAEYWRKTVGMSCAVCCRPGKTGKVLTWTVEPNAIEGWTRVPNIGFSQVGYLPSQPKISVIELDKKDTPLATASIYKISDDGKATEAFSGNIVPWETTINIIM
jgi:hypothetical protein